MMIPRNKGYHVRFEDDVLERLKEESRRQGLSITTIIRICVRDGLARGLQVGVAVGERE